MRNAVSVQQKLVFPFLKEGDVTLSPLNSIFRSHWSHLLQLFFIRGRVPIQGVHHEHHVWPRRDRGVIRPHDFKAQEAECLQEWSYQREGNLLPPQIILFTCVTLEATGIKAHRAPSVSASRASCAERSHFSVTALPEASSLSASITAAPKHEGGFSCAAEQVPPCLSYVCSVPSEERQWLVIYLHPLHRPAFPGCRWPSRSTSECLFCT